MYDGRSESNTRPQERWFEVLSVVGFHSLSREKSVLIPIASQRPLTIYDGVGHWNPKDPG